MLMVICTGLAISQSYSEVSLVNGLPAVYLNGQPFNVSGWMCGSLWQESVEEINSQIDVVAEQDFSTAFIQVFWSNIEEIQGSFYWAGLDSIFNHAQEMNVKVVVEIGVTQISYPLWYAYITYPNDGFMKNQYGEYPVDPTSLDTVYLATFYHPDFYQYADIFVAQIVDRYKNNPNLLGWMILPTFTGENNYPAGFPGIEEQVFDYSDFSAGLFGFVPPQPEEPFAYSQPDDRSEWRNWVEFRLNKKRECFEHFGTLIDSHDPDHIIGVFPLVSLGGGGFFNSFDNLQVGYEYDWLISRPWVDFVRSGSIHYNDFSFRMCEVYSYYCEYGGILAGYRHGKAVINEPTKSGSCTGNVDIEVISALSAMMQSLGAYHTWYYTSQNGPLYGVWTPSEVEKIGETSCIVALPRPEMLTVPRLAVLDFPVEHCYYYTQTLYNPDSSFITDSYTVFNNLEVVNAFSDAGIPYDALSDEEIINTPGILDDYSVLVLTLPRSRVDLYIPTLSSILDAYVNSGGFVTQMDSMFTSEMKYYYLHRYTGAFTHQILLDSVITPLRETIDDLNLARHEYPDYGILIHGLKPYFWCFIPDSIQTFSGEILFDVSDWGLPQGSITVVEMLTGDSYAGQISGEKLAVTLALQPRQTYLFSVGTAGLEEQAGTDQVILFQNNPNPFTTNTIINYEISIDGQITLELYDISGRLVRTLVREYLPAGKHSIEWDGNDDSGIIAASGVYFCRLETADRSVQTRKLILLR